MAFVSLFQIPEKSNFCLFDSGFQIELMFPSQKVNSTQRNKENAKRNKQALRGLAEHRFSNVYNYQCLTKVSYLFQKYGQAYISMV